MSADAVAARLGAVRARIDSAAVRAGRDPAGVRLVGISKRQSAEAAAAAVSAGLLDLGENYVQEAVDKIPKVEGIVGSESAGKICWHFVGQLQRNKARDVVRAFDCLHSVGSVRLAREVAKRAADRATALDVLIQVNLSDEAQKGGARAEEVAPILREIVGAPGLRAIGLMTLPAAAQDPEATRPTFAKLRALRDRLRDEPGGEPLRELSMGMSGDFEVAVEEGATLVRVGTAVFGPREG